VIKSRKLRWAGHVAHLREMRSANKILVRKPEGKRPLGRPRCRWEDNMKMFISVNGFECGFNLSGSEYGQATSSCECGNKLSGSITCGEFLDELKPSEHCVSFSRSSLRNEVSCVSPCYGNYYDREYRAHGPNEDTRNRLLQRQD
jgi:hypothetical protein